MCSLFLLSFVFPFTTQVAVVSQYVTPQPVVQYQGNPAQPAGSVPVQPPYVMDQNGLAMPSIAIAASAASDPPPSYDSTPEKHTAK